MRSLWRILALQWLGGDGSEALTGESAILEGLLGGRRGQWPRSKCGVSRRFPARR